jgi:dTDP-4-amino-4,6-dideoxygalactose transaminase
MERAAVMARLNKVGIGTQVHYLPLHMQPYYRGRYGEMSLPGAEAFYQQALSLPLFPDMKEEEVDYVVEMLNEITGAAT